MYRRFRNSKVVGAVFGLTPSRYQSGESERTGRISRWPLPREDPSQAQEPPKRGVVVVRRPHGAERQQLRIACNRPENHFRKRGGSRGFAGKTQPKTQGNKVHQGIPPNIKTLHARVVPKISKTRDEIVMNLRSRLGLTEDELLVAQELPSDLVLCAESVPVRESNEHAFCPELRHLAIGHQGNAPDEGHIEPSLSNERDVLASRTLDDLYRDVGMIPDVSSHQLTYKSGGDRRKDADTQATICTPACSSSGLDRVVELVQRSSRLFEKLSASGGDPDPGMISLEQ